MSDKLFLYQDENGHRLYSKEVRAVNCSDCGSPMRYVATIPRREGETESEHRVRTAAFGRRVK